MEEGAIAEGAAAAAGGGGEEAATGGGGEGAFDGVGCDVDVSATGGDAVASGSGAGATGAGVDVGGEVASRLPDGAAARDVGRPFDDDGRVYWYCCWKPSSVRPGVPDMVFDGTSGKGVK